MLHHAHRLRVALGIRHPVLPVEALLEVAALLVADQRDRATVEPAEAGDERAVVGAAAVAVQLDPVVEDPVDVVERVRPVLVPRELDGAPDLVFGRGRLAREPLELPAKALLLAGDARRRAAAAGSRACRAAPAAGARRHRAKSRRSRARYGALLGSGDDGVEVAEAEVVLGEAEVVGQLLARGLLDDARARRRRSARRARRS